MYAIAHVCYHFNSCMVKVYACTEKGYVRFLTLIVLGEIVDQDCIPV